MSAVEPNKEIINVQEHRNYHSELELKYDDTGNSWTLISSSAWKNGGARGVMVIVVGNEHDDTSSNPGRD